MKGTKKETIQPSTMRSILDLTLDQHNYPLLIHCNHGKHRTGCVVAAMRKTAGWDNCATVDEYRSFAEPKVRDQDIEYITALQPAMLHRLELAPMSRFTHSQVRAFFRAVLFTTFVLVLWLVSGACMKTTIQKPGSTFQQKL